MVPNQESSHHLTLKEFDIEERIPLESFEERARCMGLEKRNFFLCLSADDEGIFVFQQGFAYFSRCAELRRLASAIAEVLKSHGLRVKEETESDGSSWVLAGRNINKNNAIAICQSALTVIRSSTNYTTVLLRYSGI